MSVDIKKFDIQNKEAILDILQKDPFAYADNIYSSSDENIVAFGNGSLCGGQSEDEYAGELAKEIFTANGGPCEVEVCATYLEDLPFERYSFSAEHLPQ
jgi:hypothetical protein